MPVITVISGASNQALDGGDNACPPSELSQQFVRYMENSSKNIRRKKAGTQSFITSGPCRISLPSNARPCGISEKISIMQRVIAHFSIR